MKKITLEATLQVEIQSRSLHYGKVCLSCQRSFSAARKDQKTCCATCRKNLSLANKAKQLSSGREHAHKTYYVEASAGDKVEDLFNKAVSHFSWIGRNCTCIVSICPLEHYACVNGPLIHTEQCVFIEFGENMDTYNRFFLENEVLFDYLYKARPENASSYYTGRLSHLEKWYAFPYEVLAEINRAGLLG